MPEYYRLIFNKEVIINNNFYSYFIVISQIEFPKYTEVVIKRRTGDSFFNLRYAINALSQQQPIDITQISSPFRKETPLLSYSDFELEKLKMYYLI